MLDTCPLTGYIITHWKIDFSKRSIQSRGHMIKNFRHKGLKRLYDTGNQKGIRPEHVKRLRLILARLDASQHPQDMNLPGLGLHPLRGPYEGFWAVSVSGSWRVIFRFDGDSAVDVDYLDYH